MLHCRRLRQCLGLLQCRRQRLLHHGLLWCRRRRDDDPRSPRRLWQRRRPLRQLQRGAIWVGDVDTGWRVSSDVEHPSVEFRWMDGHHWWSIGVVRGYRQPLPVVVWEVNGEGRSVLYVEGVDQVLPPVVVEGVEELLRLVDVGETGSLMLPAAVMGSHLLARKTINVKAEKNN